MIDYNIYINFKILTIKKGLDRDPLTLVLLIITV